MTGEIVRLLLLALGLFAGMQVAMAEVGVEGAGAAALEPVTIHARVQLPDEAELKDVRGVWLAGLDVDGDGPPTALAVVWAQTGGWFPVWSLQLQSDAGLLPEDLRPGQGTGVLAGSQTFHLPGVSKPRWGHVYETMLSYDPVTGAISLWVHDATQNETLFAGEYLGGQAERHFQVRAGMLRSGGFVLAEDVELAAAYVPRGVTWGLVELETGEPSGLQLTRINRLVTEEAGIYIELVGSPEGALRVLAERDGDLSEWVVVDGASNAALTPIALDQLAPGTTKLVLEYADVDGQVQFRDYKTLEVGQLWAEFEPTTFDRESQSALGGVTLRSDAPMELALRVLGHLSRQQWDADSRQYVTEEVRTEVVYDRVTVVTPEPLRLPLEVPVPEGKGALWSVRFALEPSVDIPVAVTGADRMFTTHRSAEGVEDGPFTVVVLPDTQYQTHLSPQGGDPVIFTRMTHWIAERAAQDGIALVLHVGDITDHNRPNEWEVAQNSLYLLEGVVPYVLSVGNHDIGMGGNAADRETLLNTYFPLQRYASQPWFGGTFEPGRLENSYHRFRLGGQDYLVLSLEFLPRDEVLDWAGQVAASHPDHKVLVVTHTYTAVAGSQRSVYGERYGITSDSDSTVNTGVDIWNKLVSKHPNMFMVFSGHVTPDGSMPRQVKIGDAGNRVYEMLVNFQHRTRGGDGWLALLHFTPGSQLVGVELYSPYLGMYRADRSDAFGVPFCIDLDSPFYMSVNEACPALPEREHVTAGW